MSRITRLSLHAKAERGLVSLLKKWNIRQRKTGKFKHDQYKLYLDFSVSSCLGHFFDLTELPKREQAPSSVCKTGIPAS